jgi:predicted dehydrogenase
VEQQTARRIEIADVPALAIVAAVAKASRRALVAHVVRYNPAYEHIRTTLLV